MLNESFTKLSHFVSLTEVNGTSLKQMKLTELCEILNSDGGI